MRCTYLYVPVHLEAVFRKEVEEDEKCILNDEGLLLACGGKARSQHLWQYCRLEGK